MNTVVFFTVFHKKKKIFTTESAKRKHCNKMPDLICALSIIWATVRTYFIIFTNLMFICDVAQPILFHRFLSAVAKTFRVWWIC